MRVDGEKSHDRADRANPAPVARDQRVAVYPVPDEYVGDQVMAAIVLRTTTRKLSPESVRKFLAGAARPVAEGLAALRVDRRRPAKPRPPTRSSSAS